jgi:hypothetical protein
MSNDDKGIADPSDDQDDSQDIHRDVTSGVVADLISDREGRGRQHEMGQDFHAPFREHEIGHDNTYKAYDSNEIIDGLHQVRPIVSAACNSSAVSPYPIVLQKRKATANLARAEKTRLPDRPNRVAKLSSQQAFRRRYLRFLIRAPFQRGIRH